MQKKIIALAIASALTVPAMAYAEATISGQINMSIDLKKDGNNPEASNNVLSSNQSRLIFKGSEDLGSGLSAIWQLDNRFSADTGSVTATGGRLFDGNTFLGLQSNDFGAVKVGRIDTPYKSSTRNLDVFFDVAGDNRGALGGLMSAHDTRQDNTIAYSSPSMSGFSVAAATVFGGETPNSSANNKKGTLISLAGMYSMDNIYATLAYQSVKAGDVGTGDLAEGSAPGFVTTNMLVDDEAKAIKLGGGFTMDVFTVNAVIERPSYKDAATGVDTSNTNVYLGGKFALGSADSVRAAFTKRGATSGASNDAKQYAIGYAHDMSKTTSLYATYVKTTNNTTGAADPSALSFGMKHAF